MDFTINVRTPPRTAGLDWQVTARPTGEQTILHREVGSGGAALESSLSRAALVVRAKIEAGAEGGSKCSGG